jgi:hypothetical protein
VHATTRGRYSGWDETGLSLRCKRCRRGQCMKLCMSSVLDRQLKERSRCRSAGQPERGGNRSMLPKCKETPGQFRNKSEAKRA